MAQVKNKYDMMRVADLVVPEGSMRKKFAGIDDLAESIEKIGLINPITLNRHMRVIAGRRRLEAVKRLGWDRVPVHVMNTDDEVLIEAQENTQRMPFTPEEMAEAYRMIWETYHGDYTLDDPEKELSWKALKKKARDRSNVTGKNKVPLVRRQKLYRKNINIAQETARALGVSTRTIERVMSLKHAAEQNPEYQYLLEEMNETGNVAKPYTEYRRIERMKKVNEISKHNEQLPLGQRKFSLIYCDPPWKFQTRSDKGKTKSPQLHYPTMEMEEMLKMPVKEIIAEDSVCFMWSSAPFLKRGIELLEAWGFEYKTHAVWVKDRLGTGYHFRSQHEVLLMGTTGNWPLPEAKFPSAFRGAPAFKEIHSSKPFVVYDILEGMYPHLTEGARIELFARIKRDGWSNWGNQAPQEIEPDAKPDPRKADPIRRITTKIKKKVYEDEFEVLWQMVRKKAGKRDAYVAYCTARQSEGLTFQKCRDKIVEWNNWLDVSNTALKYTKTGGRWFTGAEWEAEYDTSDLRPATSDETKAIIAEIMGETDDTSGIDQGSPAEFSDGDAETEELDPSCQEASVKFQRSGVGRRDDDSKLRMGENDAPHPN